MKEYKVGVGKLSGISYELGKEYEKVRKTVTDAEEINIKAKRRLRARKEEEGRGGYGYGVGSKGRGLGYGRGYGYGFQDIRGHERGAEDSDLKGSGREAIVSCSTTEVGSFRR
jgi:hypothetical protein